MKGWIKLHRKTLENPVVCKDSDHLAVWIYLLLNATHKEYPMVFVGKKIILLPGQLITSRKSIADKFNISESKVQRILKLLESEQQIEQQNGNRNRLVTVLSWSEYQDIEQQNEHPVNNKRTTDEHPVNTNKNVKNIENDKNKPYNKDDDYYLMAVYLHETIMEYAESIDKAHLVENVDLQKWSEEFKNIIELDKRDEDELRKVIDWCTNDIFWRKVILSPTKLRDKYVELALRMDDNPQSNSPKTKFRKNKELLQRGMNSQDPEIAFRNKEIRFQQYVTDGGVPEEFDWSS